MKRVISIFLSLLLIISFSCNVFAKDFANLDKSYVLNNRIQPRFTKNEILTLEKYVYVDKKGFFKLNTMLAKNDGIDNSLLEGQQKYFDYLNSLIKEGKITAYENLEIRSNNINNLEVMSDSHWPSCGGGLNTDVEYHWWGYSRYACDCETQRMSADFNSVASVSAGITIVAAYFGAIPAIPPGLSSAYFWLLASRLDANNHGKGVYIEMTWALVFDITPQ